MSDPQGKFQPQAFPTLTEEQIALLHPLGEVQATKAGDVLYEVGDATYPLVVVLSGQTAIVDRSEESDQVIATTGPGGFNGDRDDSRAERRADHGICLASPAPDAGRGGDADPDRT